MADYFPTEADKKWQRDFLENRGNGARRRWCVPISQTEYDIDPVNKALIVLDGLPHPTNYRIEAVCNAIGWKVKVPDQEHVEAVIRASKWTAYDSPRPGYSDRSYENEPGNPIRLLVTLYKDYVFCLATVSSAGPIGVGFGGDSILKFPLPKDMAHLCYDLAIKQTA